MKPGNKRFLIILVILIAVLSGITILFKNSYPQLVTPYWSILFLFFTIVNIVVYFLTMKMKSSNNASKFTNFYMGTTVVKLLVYLAVIITFLIIFPEGKKNFIATFLFYYLCFTFFETFVLVKNKN